MSASTKNTNILKPIEYQKFSLQKYTTFILVCLFLLVLITSILGLASEIPDSDSFFIIRTGEYIVENNEVPKINPFVIHEDFSVIIQQWSFDVIVYLLYNTFGYAGLFVFSAITLLVAIFMTNLFISMYTKNVNHKLLLLSLFTWVFRDWAVVRPTSISFSLLFCVILIMEVYRREKAKCAASGSCTR